MIILVHISDSMGNPTYTSDHNSLHHLSGQIFIALDNYSAFKNLYGFAYPFFVKESFPAIFVENHVWAISMYGFHKFKVIKVECF